MAGKIKFLLEQEVPRKGRAETGGVGDAKSRVAPRPMVPGWGGLQGKQTTLTSSCVSIWSQRSRDLADLS